MIPLFQPGRTVHILPASVAILMKAGQQRGRDALNFPWVNLGGSGNSLAFLTTTSNAMDYNQYTWEASLR